jgi:hypothetical protein
MARPLILKEGIKSKMKGGVINEKVDTYAHLGYGF